MTKPNFQTMSRKELRAYVLAHREDDSAFYALVDRSRETASQVEATVTHWLKSQYPDQQIAKTTDRPAKLWLQNRDGSQRKIIIQLMMSSLPVHRPLIDQLIADRPNSDGTDSIPCTTIAVAKAQSDALQLKQEFHTAEFVRRTGNDLMVGYIEPQGTFQIV